MADKLLASHISKVTDIVPADCSLRFCVEYLGIDHNQFKTIEYNAKFIHHDVLFKCIECWKNGIEGQGLDAKEELHRLLAKVQQERHWFMKEQLMFLTISDNTEKMSIQRKCY